MQTDRLPGWQGLFGVQGATWEWADFRRMLDAAHTDLRKEDCCTAATASSRAGVKGVR